MGGGEVEGVVVVDGEYGWVDVGDGDVDVWVEVLGVGVLEYVKGDIVGVVGYVEDFLGLILGGCCVGVEGGDEVVFEYWVSMLVLGSMVKVLLENIFLEMVDVEGYEVVYFIVGFGDVGKYFGDMVCFFGFRNSFIVEMGGFLL